MNQNGGKGTKYISFKNSTSDTRIGALHINKMNNVEVKYEYIQNVDMNNIVEYKRQIRTIHNILLDIKINNMPLFTRVEQGSGQRKYCVFMLITPRLRRKAQLWLKQNFRMKLKFLEDKK